MIKIGMKTSKKIVLAEDNPADVKLAQLALRGLPSEIEMVQVGNGKELLEYLRSVPYEEVAFVLLDLNMPMVSGHDFLQIRKQEPNIQKMPVIVFTCSNDYEDIENAYFMGANAYINKPVDLDEYEQTFQSIIRFWCGVTIQVSL